MSAEGRRPLDGEDDGFALIASLLVTVIVSAVVLVVIGTAMGGLRGSAGHRDREGAVHAAEAAADVVAERIAADPAYATGHTWPFSSPPTPAQEREYARSLLAAALTAATAPPSLLTVPSVTCVVSSGVCPPMYALGIRPSGPSGPLNVAYGVAHAPGEDPSSARVVRMDILRSGYTPGHAVLTGSNTKVDGELVLLGTHANLHTNGDLEVRRTTLAAGNVTSTGAFAGLDKVFVPPSKVKAGAQPAVAVPAFTATDFYARRFDYPEADWYDLCPDGRAHSRSSGPPCSGPIRATPVGFTPGGGKWEIRGEAFTNGIFYVHEANFENSGNAGRGLATRPRITVIASRGAVECGAGGSIDISGEPHIDPYMSDGTLFIGDREVVLRQRSVLGQASAPAFVGAGGRIKTDNDLVFHGAIIAQNRCPGELNELKGKTQITYDGNLTLGIGGGPPRIGTWHEL